MTRQWLYALDLRATGARFPGVGRYARNLARAMAPLLAADEALLLIQNPGPRPVEIEHPRVIWRELAAPPGSLAEQWAAPRLLLRHGATACLFPWPRPPLWPGVPALVTIHDLIPLRFPKQSSWKARAFFGANLRLACRTCGTLLVPSQSTADDLRQWDSRLVDRVWITPEAADPQFASPSKQAVENSLRRLGVGRPYALMLGSRRPHKNVDRLIEAWRSVEGCVLALAGPGQERPLASAPQNVICLGPVAETDLPALYAGARLVVVPSLWEGFGLPVLEAMACGAPVACSRAGALPETAGDAAALFDPLDVTDMARVLRELLADEGRLAELTQRGLTRAGEFSWTETARLTLEALRQAAEREGGRPRGEADEPTAKGDEQTVEGDEQTAKGDEQTVEGASPLEVESATRSTPGRERA